MQIFGLDPVLAALIFTALGGSLQLLLGWLGTTDASFSWRKAVSTALVTVVVGVVVVATTLGTIAEDATELEVLIIVAGVVGTVAGYDGLKNSIINAAGKKK